MEVFDIEKTLRAILSDGKDSPCIFDRLLERFENYYTRPVSSLGEMKRRDNKRIKGNAWEQFCQFYLVRVLGYNYAWLWHEVPDHFRVGLKLGSKVDNGIDIVCIKILEDGKQIINAVQCKYRKKITQTVTWTTLSTFVGLCSRTGPWHEHIVMTNCKGVSGKTGIPRGPKDKTMAYGTFKKLNREMCTRQKPGDIPITQTASNNNDNNTKPKTMEELRAIRLSFFKSNEEIS
jgi:hypothetical protein